MGDKAGSKKTISRVQKKGVKYEESA